MPYLPDILGNPNKKPGDKTYSVGYTSRPGVYGRATIYAPNEAEAKKLFKKYSSHQFRDIVEVK